MFPFTGLAYLEHGNPRQQEAFRVLTQSSLFEKLESYDPILVGSIPLGIDLPSSDLDVICHAQDLAAFKAFLLACFSDEKEFRLKEKIIHQKETVIAHFTLEGFPVEVFGQDLPTQNQMAFRHMIIEYHILKKFDEEFKEKIIELKASGLKTEPAFAQLLELEGDPYLALLDYPLEENEK